MNDVDPTLYRHHSQSGIDGLRYCDMVSLFMEAWAQDNSQTDGDREYAVRNLCKELIATGKYREDDIYRASTIALNALNKAPILPIQIF